MLKKKKNVTLQGVQAINRLIGILLSTLEETMQNLQVPIIYSTKILSYLNSFIYSNYTYLFYSSALWEIAFCHVYRLIIFPKGTVSGWNKYIVILVLSSRKFSVCSLKRDTNNYVYFNAIMFYSTCLHSFLNIKQVCSP